MVNSILAYTGSAIIIIWGIAHIIPTRSVVKGFGEISQENRRIITMEWIAEGLTLCFIGVLVLLVAIWGGMQNQTAILTIRACAVMLIVMAVLTLSTGARTSIIPIKICPLVKTVVAILFLMGSVI